VAPVSDRPDLGQADLGQADLDQADLEPVAFVCDGVSIDVDVEPGESLLSVLRERLGVMSVKDGCAPQGQCGCCTVLVDGSPRVACVTPVERVAGRSVTTVDGLDPEHRDALAGAFLSTGGSQCGFCTPGIVVRAAALLARSAVTDAEIDRALAAHLCRCTGWRTVHEAIALVSAQHGGAELSSSTDVGALSDAGGGWARQRAIVGPASPSDRSAGARRAALEGGVTQRVAPDVSLGAGGFADDSAPRGVLVAVPRPPDSDVSAVEAAGIAWVVGESLHAARAAAGKIQGRRTTQAALAPLALPPCPDGGVRLATSWVEPAYLEPDASWCEPGGEPVSPLANGGAFGAKRDSAAPAAARLLADRLGRTVRVVFSREEVVRLGPKRPPIGATAVLHGRTPTIAGLVVGEVLSPSHGASAYALDPWDEQWVSTRPPGPPTSSALRSFPFAERTVLLEGALDAAGVDRLVLVRDGRAAAVLLDTCAVEPDSGAASGARVTVDPATGNVSVLEVRVAAGDPLDEVVLRSYCIGAAHMALGWVLTEGLTVDPETGEVLDLTIRSFGVIRAKDTPPITVTIIDDAGPPLARASDAVFAAVASATWNAVARADGARPEAFPALETRAARRLRR
jgi:aerobic-type carbon monoxide dehydrogenase small subunit (CoxS/CutS family)